MTYLHAFSSIIALSVNVLAQVYYCRFISNKHLLKSLFFGFFCGVLGFSIVEIYYMLQSQLPILQNISSVVINMASYSALGYCYFHFVNLGETARRIRMISELKTANSGLSAQQILERYNAREIIEKRLGRLLKSNQVIYRNGRYYIGKPFMLVASKIIVFLKLFILGKKSEFEE
ncbi:MAG: hypothetical protein WC330_02415 [Candidatus Omnitrophota bacterium]|jgi:hypothetical protein